MEDRRRRPTDKPPLGSQPRLTHEVRLSRELPYPQQSSGSNRRGLARYTHLTAVVLAAAALTISVVVLLLILGEDRTSIEEATTVGATDIGSDEGDETDDPDDGDGGTEVAPAAPQERTVEGPYVRATLDGPDFSLDGVVPSAALAGRLLQSAEVAYSPFVQSTLIVDEQLDEVDWLAASPDAIVLLPIITDGTLLMSEGAMEISGRSPSPERVDRLQGALAQVTGLPVEVGSMEITGLAPPDLLLTAEGGRVVLNGRLPSEELRQGMVAGAVAAYGNGKVEDQITVDSGVFTSLWMYSGDQLLRAMSAFPEYQLRIEGTAFSGFINGGVTFETGSAEFSGNYAEVLDVGVAVLTRDQSLQLVIEGHTDSVGSAEVNLELSQQRAEAVLDYFVEHGIAQERLTAVGKGETEPVVPNDTAEGQARNRRIVYLLTSRQ